MRSSVGNTLSSMWLVYGLYHVASYQLESPKNIARGCVSYHVVSPIINNPHRCLLIIGYTQYNWNNVK